MFADPGNPFDQVIIQVTDACRYDELMKVVDICTQQTLPDGKKLSKLSFVEVAQRIRSRDRRLRRVLAWLSVVLGWQFLRWGGSCTATPGTSATSGEVAVQLPPQRCLGLCGWDGQSQKVSPCAAIGENNAGQRPSRAGTDAAVDGHRDVGRALHAFRAGASRRCGDGWLARDGGKHRRRQQAPALSRAGCRPPRVPPTKTPSEAEEARLEFQALTDGSEKLRARRKCWPMTVWWDGSRTNRLPGSTSGRKKACGMPICTARRTNTAANWWPLTWNVRLVNDLGSMHFGFPLHELWGATEESRGRLYDAIVLDYPAEMPDRGFVHEKVRFVGYFLKLQGYEPATAKPGQAPDGRRC